MEYTDHRSKGGIGAAAFVTVPVGMALAAALGALYALAPVYNPWSIANIVAFVAAMFGLGASCIVIARFGKIRGKGLPLLLGLLAGVVFTLATFEAIRLISQNASGQPALGPVAFHRARLATGITLFGSAGLVKGWLLGAIWILGLLLAILVSVTVCEVESNHPYCDECGSWARRQCWKFELVGPDTERLRRAKSGGRAHDLTVVTTGGPKDRSLVTKVESCRCGAVAHLAAEVIKPGSEVDTGNAIVLSQEVSARDLDELFTWAESVSTKAPRRPDLSVLDRLQEEKKKLREPYELPEMPESGEHISKFRWDGGVTLDAEANNAITKSLRARLMLGDYSAAELALSKMRHPSDRSFVAHACADWRVEPTWLRDWMIDNPHSAEAHLIRGIYGVGEAWKIRGVGWVPKNVDAFMGRLEEADRDLELAAALSPKDPTPWAWMLWTCKGRQLGMTEARRRFDEALARSPGHRAAHTFMLDFLKPKWFGSREMVEAFVEDTMRRARPGSHMLVVVPEAAYELAYFHAPDGKKPDAKAYLQSPGVAERIRRANEMLFKSDRFKPNMDTPRTRVWFAYMLWQTGALDEAAEHLRIIGPSTPWSPFPPPVLRFAKDTLRKARKQCGVTGGRAVAD